jgi:hypothetical protein
MTSWLDFRTEPVIDTMHESIVDGNEVTCNYLHCTYREVFDSVEDAEFAAIVHEEQNRNA